MHIFALEQSDKQLKLQRGFRIDWDTHQIKRNTGNVLYINGGPRFLN